MIPKKMLEVLKNEGIVAIVTQGKTTPHVVNTWNSYITITDDEKLLVPVGGMNTTESNLKVNSSVLVTLGSREVEGFHYKGTGFLITGSAKLVGNGLEFDKMKQRFTWIRAMLVIVPETIEQTL